MEFAAFKDWALLGMLGSSVLILFEGLKSVQELNIKIAVICKTVEDHDKRIEDLEND